MKLRVKRSSACIDHCLIFALTEEKSKYFNKEKCNHEHTEHRNSCGKVEMVMSDIEDILVSVNLGDDTRSYIEHDFDFCKRKKWKA